MGRSTADVLIVGAGPAGAATARALAILGARVSVMQPPERPGSITAPPGAAWTASAGMLAAQTEFDPGDQLWPLAIAGREFYRREAPILARETGIPLELLEGGIALHLPSMAEASIAARRVAWHRVNGQSAHLLNPRAAARRWPWLGQGLGALWFPGDSAVDPTQVVAALRADLIRRGVTMIADRAVALDRARGGRGGGRLEGVIGIRGRYHADRVVLAAGVWSATLAGLPRELPVHPVRGQMFAVPWPRGADPGVVYGDHCYVLQRGAEMLVGATLERAGYSARVTSRGIASLRRRAAAMYSELDSLRARRRWAGLRPGTPDDLPILGVDPALPELFHATGYGRQGILLAGVVGEAVAAEIAGRASTIDLEPFRVARFATASRTPVPPPPPSAGPPLSRRAAPA